MTCRTVKTEHGVAIVCSRQRSKPCSVMFCGRPSVSLCDYPVERNGVKGTCDSPMCERHRHTVERREDDTVDYCDTHWRIDQREKGLVP